MWALEDELVLGRHCRRFRSGEPIYFEGDSAETWFDVTEGVARTCRFYDDGHRQVTGFLYAGDVFGLDETSRLESAEAVTAVACLCITKPISVPTNGAAAAIVPEYERALMKAFLGAQRSIFLFGRRTAPQRLAAFLLMTADHLRVQTDLELPMGRSDIADYLGLTIYTVSRTLTQLCEDRLIAVQDAHRCRLLDRTGLAALARGQDWAPARGGGTNPVAVATPPNLLSKAATPSKLFGAPPATPMSSGSAPSCHRAVE